jgi:hypothetical protein
MEFVTSPHLDDQSPYIRGVLNPGCRSSTKVLVEDLDDSLRCLGQLRPPIRLTLPKRAFYNERVEGIIYRPAAPPIRSLKLVAFSMRWT